MQQARTYPFLTHKCGDVSQIEPIDDFYDAQGRRIQGYIWIPKLQQSQESESQEKATEGKEGLRGVVLFNHVGLESICVLECEMDVGFTNILKVYRAITTSWITSMDNLEPN